VKPLKETTVPEPVIVTMLNNVGNEASAVIVQVEGLYGVGHGCIIGAGEV
jgi:hypothetical protein